MIIRNFNLRLDFSDMPVLNVLSARLQLNGFKEGGISEIYQRFLIKVGTLVSNAPFTLRTDHAPELTWTLYHLHYQHGLASDFLWDRVGG
jgi:hypothetical protein